MICWLCVGVWICGKRAAWHTVERKVWHMYDIHIIHDTAMYMTWYQGTGSSRPCITTRVIQVQHHECTCITPGMLGWTSGSTVPNWQVGVQWSVMCCRSLSKALRYLYIWDPQQFHQSQVVHCTHIYYTHSPHHTYYNIRHHNVSDTYVLKIYDS